MPRWTRTYANILVDENINLPRGADLQRGIDELWCLGGLTDVCLDNDGFGAVGLDFLCYLLGALEAVW